MGLAALALCSVTRATSAHGQASANCQPSTTEVMACTVRGFAVISQYMPRYPDILRQAGVGGVVHFRILIDTSGRVVIRSYKVLSSSHDLFAVAVRNAAPAWRFVRPGGADGPAHAVYEAAFLFVPAPSLVFKSEGSPPPEITAPAGSRIVDAVEVNRISWEIVKYLVSKEPTMNPRPVFCTTATEHETIFLGGRWLVPRKLCPRTYASMISSGRSEDVAPRGWVDPVWYRTLEAVRHGSDFVSLRIERERGPGGVDLKCSARLRPATVEEIVCQEGVRHFH